MWRAENPSRVVNLESAPNLTRTWASWRLPSKQDCCNAVLPSSLYSLRSTFSECFVKKSSMSFTLDAKPIKLWNCRCSFASKLDLCVLWMEMACFVSTGNVVTGLRGWSISSYLVANLGCLLFKLATFMSLSLLERFSWLNCGLE